MSADPVRTIDHTAARPSALRPELDRTADDHREPWPTVTDASPQRSAVVGLLREHHIDPDRVDVAALTATRGHGAIDAAARRLGVPLAALQVAILQDTGACTLVRVHGDVDAADLVVRTPTLTPNDRDLAEQHLRHRPALGPPRD